MKISPSYMRRSDLTTSQKWRFTLEERMQHNRFLCAVHDTFLRFPVLQILFVVPWILAGILPIILSQICITITRKIFVNKYGEGPEEIWVVLFCTVLCGITFLHPLGWVLIGITFYFFSIGWVWGVMHTRILYPEPNNID